MLRKKATPPSAATFAEKSKKPRMSSAERSSYFARREAAKVLRCALQGDARRRALGSIKSLVYSPSVRNKKATYALVCQTLKFLPVIKEVLEANNILNSKWKRQLDLIYIITYDILFSQETSWIGDAEKYMLQQKHILQSALARFLVRRKLKSIEELIDIYQPPDTTKPRYVRVNTLKLDVDSACEELGKLFKVQKDSIIPDLLVLPPKSDLHDHPLVLNGSLFLQGKASSLVAAALAPDPGWKVLDACAAPGNKTVQLAALMGGKGEVIACEMSEERIKRLEETVRLSGACNVEILHTDFLTVDPKDAPYSKVQAILLDPSCSGSGTAADRLDHLFPSNASGEGAEGTEKERLNKLATFQRKALAHALSFPEVEKVVYSTCSVEQIENEDVVSSVLPLATSLGFQLAAPFPQWPRRGLPLFDGADKLVRFDPLEDKEGFFIALFARSNRTDSKISTEKRLRRRFMPPIFFRGHILNRYLRFKQGKVKFVPHK